MLATKVCNDIMPTAVSLKKMKYQSNDQCCLCNQLETRDDMIRCLDRSRTKWRLQYINRIRTRLIYLETDKGVTNALCTAITEWFDTKEVKLVNYDPKYHQALITQTNIGWRQIFMGRLSQDWLTLQGSYTTDDDIYRESYVMVSSIVEISLKKFMELWKERNQDVHGKTEAQQQSRWLQKLRIEIRKLPNLRDQTRPSDDFIFHDDLDGFLKLQQQPEQQTISVQPSGSSCTVLSKINWGTAMDLRARPIGHPSCCIYYVEVPSTRKSGQLE